ncbi:hypothetical protein GOBAR_AA36660 [Gossypium barbadense]|uniref:Uncharacterized protein n=1 Tax=Gossypium barbadense TaxID=3634 RepID=A0A2P5VYX6_GOSBA|nr:hypothetical protein GOBAR_AA36660 [Gossypium barbadense]
MRVKIGLGGRSGGHTGRGNQAHRSGFVDEDGNCQERREACVPVEANAYLCSTKQDEMGTRRLSDTEGGFLLSLHVLEAEFHLPLYLFFCIVLQEYRITPGQLVGFS